MTSILNIGGVLYDLGTRYQYSEGIDTSDQEIPEEFVYRMMKESGEFTKEEMLAAHGRARRARYALSLAVTFAAADGPLPIGDVIAIGILGVYAGYEMYRIVEDYYD